MVGSLVGEWNTTAAGRSEGFLFVDSPARERESSMGRIRPANRTGAWQQHRKWCNQLLRAASRRRVDDREYQPGVSGAIDRLREVPQPSSGKMDQRPVLRDVEPVGA